MYKFLQFCGHQSLEKVLSIFPGVITCLVVFWGVSILTCPFIFLNVIPVTCFGCFFLGGGEEKSMDGCVDGII